MKKILTAIGTTAFFLMTGPMAFAVTPTDPGTGGVGDGNISPCQNASGITATLCKGQDLGQVLGFVVTIAFIVAILVALGFLLLGGIKWITSGGDKTGVEAARNQIIAAVIGLIIVFLAFFILNLVLGLFGLNLFNLQLPKFPGA